MYKKIGALILFIALSPIIVSAQAAVLGYKLNNQYQIADSGFTPTLVGPAGTVTLSGNPYNSGFITNGTYTSFANAGNGWTSSYWLCYNQQGSCSTPAFVNGTSVTVNLQGNAQSGDHVTLWWRYAEVQNLGAVLGYKLDGTGAHTSIGAPTVVGPAGTVSLSGNPYNSGFITGGSYTAYANAPSGYTASYWLCYEKQSPCTTQNYVNGNSVVIDVSGTGQSGDYVTLWWKYTAIPTNASCMFNGSTVAHGASVTAYQTSSVPAGQSCTTVSEQRTCNNGTLSGTYAHAQCSTLGSPSIPRVIPGQVPNKTSEWTRGTVLLKNFVNMYNGHIHYESGDAFPYKMWFFGWAAHTCNNAAWPSGPASCDAIFFARSTDGVTWQVYSGDINGTPTFDSTQSPSLWKPVVSAQNLYYDQVHNGDPTVVKVGGTYYMVYSVTGKDLDGITSGQPGDTDQDFQGIMGAVSSDGIHWQKANRPYFVSPTEAGGRDTAPGNMYHRPSLMYEDGKFKMWFDYWVSDTEGLSMGYAELPQSNPTPDGFLAGTFTPIRTGSSPLIINWPNPNVIKVGSTYYSYADPVVTTLSGWQGRALTEASSPDGINWTIRGYVNTEAGCAATHVPEAYTFGGVLYVTYGCQIGGTPTYDYRYNEIRRMQKIIATTAQPASTQTTPAIPPAQPVAPALPSNTTPPATCPNLTRNLYRPSRGVDVIQLQNFLIAQGDLAPGNTTGFFGSLTETAVKKFQCRTMRICSGFPWTNGYGVVGPQTRAVIASQCTPS